MGVFLLFNIGGGELALILIVILILFGGKGIPSLARTLGKAMREFRNAASGVEREIYGLQNESRDVIRQIEEKIQEVKKELPKTD